MTVCHPPHDASCRFAFECRFLVSHLNVAFYALQLANRYAEQISADAIWPLIVAMGKKDKPKLLLIGALPPPYIGPSIAMADILGAPQILNEYRMTFCDISDRRELVSLGKFDLGNVWLGVVHILKCFGLMLVQRPNIVYFGISQGLWGYLRDLGFFIPAILLRKKVVIHLRGSEFDTFYAKMPSFLRIITRFLFRRVACVIILSDRLKHIFAGLVPLKSMAVVPNGIDCEIFGANDESIKCKYNGNRILWLSNLFARKGFFKFIESLPAIFAEHPEAAVTVAGDWESNELRDRSLEFIKKHGLQTKIFFSGRVNGEEKLRLYKTHDVFVLPVIEPEGMPWSILEAMSAGLAVVSCAQGAIPDLVMNGQTGFLIDPTPQAIAACLNNLITNPELARAAGVRARRHVQSNFSKNVYLSKLASALASATAR